MGDAVIDFARDEMISVQETLDADVGTSPPSPFRESSPRSFGVADIPVDRYTSPEFLQHEYRYMWSKVWQWACREEDMPAVGDHVVYDIGDTSIVIARSAPDEFKAFHNSCLHRGRQLKTGPGNSLEFNCPFHGWSWYLDGALKHIPCKWDFPQLSDTQRLSLPEVKLARWAGFIFVNLDPHCRPLEEHLDILPEHFKSFPLDRKFTALHLSKLMPANWKIVMEAFLESYHVARTHPRIVEFVGDANTQYDIWNTVNRMHSTMGTPSPHLGADVDHEAIYESARAYYAGPLVDLGPAELPSGSTPRHALAALVKNLVKATTAADISTTSDSEIVDAVQYWVFPNWCPWAGITNGLQYRFRPNGHDPHTSIFDIRLMAPLPANGERPPPAPVRYMDIDEPFANVAELFTMGSLFDDDVVNMGPLQRGLRARVTSGAPMAEYQESRIRHFHALLEQAIASGSPVKTG